MHDQRHLTQDAVLRAQIAMANRLIAEQSAAIARAHSAIERAMETLGGPDGEGPTNTIAAPVTSICLRTNAGASAPHRASKRAHVISLGIADGNGFVGER